MMLEGTIEKLRGSVEFDFDSQTFHETGASLSFQNQQGVSLDWSGTQARFERLQFIKGEFIFKVFVPALQVVHNQIDGGGSHYRGTGSELYASLDNADPRGRQFSKALINVPLLHEFVNVSVPSWKQGTNYDLSYEWKNSLLELGRSFPENASIWIRIAAHAENDLVSGISLRPRPQVGIDFATPVSFETARAYTASLRELFEILSTRPSGELTTRFYQDESCVVLREPLEKRSLGSMTSLPLSLKYSLCGPHLPQMIGPWLTKIGTTPAVDNLLRLLYYPDLPTDLRYFMAFSALGYLNVEQRHSGNHRTKIAEVQHLRAFTHWWNLLVPFASNVELEKYLKRVANTRNNIAHLSRPRHEVISERKDLLRAFNQLHVLARACLFENMGLPTGECATYVDSLSKYLNKHFGPVPPQLLL